METESSSIPEATEGAQVVLRARNGDREAREELTKRFSRLLESVIRVTYLRGDETIANMEAEIARSFSEYRLINRVLDFGDDEETNVYVVRPRRGGDTEDVESRLRSVDGVVRLSLYQSVQHAPF